MSEIFSSPKIGLALGGGVARGWAHIGVIHRLLEAGIKPDIICGTSIGAVVGGFYLANHLDTLEEWARVLTKRRLLAYLDLLSGSNGLVGGKRLERLMLQYLDGMKIEALPAPFAAVTAELATGHEIWVQNGSLVDAIRASYALPGVFPPMHIDHRWLIDGALVNPVPVSVCRALGARLVIAVSLNSDSFGKGSMQEDQIEADIDFGVGEAQKISSSPTSHRKLIMQQFFGIDAKSPSMGNVLGALGIVLDRLARSRMAGDPADIMIAPRLGHIGLLEFDRAADMIDLGREATDHMMPHIEEALTILNY